MIGLFKKIFGIGYSCEDVGQRLFAYIDGELPEDEVKLLKQHVEKCPKCYNKIRLEEMIKQRVKSSHKTELTPSSLKSEILTKIEELKAL